jgi:hypothetical protein
MIALYAGYVVFGLVFPTLFYVLYYIWTKNVIKSYTYRYGYPIMICLVSVLNCFALAITRDIQNLTLRIILGYATLFTTSLMVLLNIETLAIFKILNPKASKWFVIIPRVWMIFIAGLCFVFASWNYYLLGRGISSMDPLARLLRLIHGLSVIVSIQVLTIYWLVLVRTTLKKRPTGEICTLLRRAQIYVIVICVICLVGNAVYVYFELIPYDDPRKIDWIMWPSLFVGSAVLPMFQLFLTMIQIKMIESKWKVPKQNAPIATTHVPIIASPRDGSEIPNTLM